MHKSKDVPITILAALALFTTACQDDPVSRNCVDAQNRIAPDANCSASGSGSSSSYRYVYGGSSGGHIGDAVVGGSATAEGVSRGGFGHGGGEGGE